MAGCSYPLTSLKTGTVNEPGLRAPIELPGSLRGRAVVLLRGIEEREFKGKAAILVKGPDKVRIEIFDIFGQVAAVIVSDGLALSIFSNNQSNFFERGGDTPLIFKATELAGFLMGADIGAGEAAKRPSPSSSEEQEGISEAREILFEDYRDLEGQLFPFSLSVDDGIEKLSVRYSSIELNPELNDDLFVHIVAGTLNEPGKQKRVIKAWGIQVW